MIAERWVDLPYRNGVLHCTRTRELTSPRKEPRDYPAVKVPPDDGLDPLRAQAARILRTEGPQTRGRLADLLDLDGRQVDRVVVDHPWFSLEAGRVYLERAGWIYLETHPNP